MPRRYKFGDEHNLEGMDFTWSQLVHASQVLSYTQQQMRKAERFVEAFTPGVRESLACVKRSSVDNDRLLRRLFPIRLPILNSPGPEAGYLSNTDDDQAVQRGDGRSHPAS